VLSSSFGARLPQNHSFCCFFAPELLVPQRACAIPNARTARSGARPLQTSSSWNPQPARTARSRAWLPQNLSFWSPAAPEPLVLEASYPRSTRFCCPFAPELLVPRRAHACPNARTTRSGACPLHADPSWHPQPARIARSRAQLPQNLSFWSPAAPEPLVLESRCPRTTRSAARSPRNFSFHRALAPVPMPEPPVLEPARCRPARPGTRNPPEPPVLEPSCPRTSRSGAQLPQNHSF
jgi:hypothetical protein